MSDTKINKLRKVPPILIKKNALKINRSNGDYDFLLRCVKNTSQVLIKEDEIYRSTNDDFLKGKYPKLILVNKLNILMNTSQTIATFTQNSVSVKLTSDAIVRVIGQKNYDTLFSALCSIISLETRVQGILSLLSPVKVKETTSTGSQTIESCRAALIKRKKQRNRRKTVSPYVITDHLMQTSQKETFNDKTELLKESDIKIECGKTEKASEATNKNSEFPELKQIVNEDSNISDTSVGNISLNSTHIPGIVENTKTLLSYIEDHTISQLGQRLIRLMDGTELIVKGNPDNLHLATPDILKELSPIQRAKLLWHQAYIDWEMCMQRDEDQNLPLHWAVLNNDLDLLKRQCVVLKSRQESIDILAGNMTALQMSLLDSSYECTEILLRYDADVLATDDETKTALHLAAERDHHHTDAVLQHCRSKARLILKDHDELWEEGFEEKSDDVLGEYLINKISVMCDDGGYTPLMLASKAGNHACVSQLVRAAPYTVNMVMPTCGNTALYLVVTAACLEANNSLNKSKIDEKFLKTIECLVVNGADPSIVNDYGSSVNDLLNEFNITQLSMLIANKLTSIKYMGGRTLEDFSSYMLIKNSCGGVNITHVREPSKTYKKTDKTQKKAKEQEIVAKKHTEVDTEIKQNSRKSFIKITPHKAQKSNSKIDTNDKDILEPRKRQHTTIYTTVPVVRVVSYKNTTENMVIIQDKEINAQKTSVKKSLPIKILPKMSKPIKINPVAVKRSIQQTGHSNKRSKNTEGK